MDRSKIVAVITGAIALLLSIAYLLLVQFLDFRGEMVPAPITGQFKVEPAATAPQAIAPGYIQIPANGLAESEALTSRSL